VNIATFHLGRDEPGGSAIALVQVDQPLPPPLVDKIAKLESVVQAKVLGF
jgi:D-3-phosphoglycerate dehydrogenase